MSNESTNELGGFLVIEQVAPMLHMAESTLSERCRRGRFPHVRFPHSRRLLIPRADLEEYMANPAIADELEVTLLAGGGRIVKPKTGGGAG